MYFHNGITGLSLVHLFTGKGHSYIRIQLRKHGCDGDEFIPGRNWNQQLNHQICAERADQKSQHTGWMFVCYFPQDDSSRMFIGDTITNGFFPLHPVKGECKRRSTAWLEKIAAPKWKTGSLFHSQTPSSMRCNVFLILFPSASRTTHSKTSLSGVTQSQRCVWFQRASFWSEWQCEMCLLPYTICCFHIEHYHCPLVALCAEREKAMGNPHDL